MSKPGAEFKSAWVIFLIRVDPCVFVVQKNKLRQTGRGWRIVTACICALFSCREISTGEACGNWHGGHKGQTE